MTASPTLSPAALDLTAEQQPIVQASPAANILVTAGPGTGKTHVLVARIAELVGRHDLSPGDEILVLSFSRAAVREIGDRAKAAGGDVGYVRAFTFDSFATRLLADIVPDAPWTDVDYDGRIRCAVELIRRDPEAQERIAGYRHVLVDEVQDLVADRAELVKSILEASSGGFTLLGDPAQGIYNFQLEGDARRIGSAALYAWLRKRFGGDLIEYRLTVNHRARSDAARAALWAGAELNGPNPDFPRIKYELDSVVMGLMSWGDVEHAAPLLRGSVASTAALCRDNGQALVLSRELWAQGVAHNLQRSATDRVVAPWIGQALGGLDRRRIGRTAFLQRVEPVVGTEAAFPAWRMLKRLDLRSADDLDLVIVADRIRSGNVPDELCVSSSQSFVVSTIHRAKGLEFERVLITDPRKYDGDEDPIELAEEARLLYVALTRPKQHLYHLGGPDCSGLHKKSNQDERWIRGFGWRVMDIEIRGTDIHAFDPAGSFVLTDCDPVQTQEYIGNSVHPGDSVDLTRIEVIAEDKCRYYYVIKHDGHIVGITSEQFGSVLFHGLRAHHGWKVKWPTEIKDIRVEAVDTVAGTPEAGLRCGLGPSGLWLRVRVAGLGRLMFRKL